MKKFVIAIILFTNTLFISSQEFDKGSIIVKFKSNELKDDPIITKVLKNYAYIKAVKLNNFVETSQIQREILSLKFDDNTDIYKVIEELKNTDLFEYIEPNYIAKGAGTKGELPLTTTPNETMFSRQWGLKNDGSFSLSTAISGADVTMESAWDITTGNTNITMAVLDSGLRMTHPEIASRIWVNTDESLNLNDSDGNQYLDDINGWDFVNDDNDPTDDHGHGTNVTGIATATGDNGIGYAGIDWKCKIMPIKVLDDTNSGLYSWMISGIYYAVHNGANVINMSIGGSGFSQGLKDAVDYAHSQNVPMLISMMNFNNDILYYPAAYENSIAVGSTDPDDTRSSPFFWSTTSGSNYGDHIDVVAPGNYIYGLSSSSDTYYNSYWGGTSQAAPLVAGLVTLLLDISPNKTVEEIRTLLRETADDEVGDSEDIPGWDPYYGAGRVNATSLLNAVLSLTTKDFNINTFRVYPNPAKNKIHLPQELNNKEFTIYSILGRKILKGFILNKSIDLHAIKNGTYFLKINFKNTQVIKKIIKI